MKGKALETEGGQSAGKCPEKLCDDKALESTVRAAGTWPIHVMVWHETKRNTVSFFVLRLVSSKLFSSPEKSHVLHSYLLTGITPRNGLPNLVR